MPGKTLRKALSDREWWETSFGGGGRKIKSRGWKLGKKQNCIARAHSVAVNGYQTTSKRKKQEVIEGSHAQ